MVESQPNSSGQQDPLKYVLDSARKATSAVVTLYAELVFHPYQFAEKRIRNPEATALIRAGKHLLWLIGAFSGLFSLVGDISVLRNGSDAADQGLAILAKNFVMALIFAFQIIPIAAALWLILRYKRILLSQCLLIFIYIYNTLFGSAVLISTVVFAMGVLIVVADLLLSIRPEVLVSTAVQWIFAVPLILAFVYLMFHILFYIGPNLIRGSVDVGRGKALLFMFLAMAIGAIPFDLVLIRLLARGIE